MSTNILNIEQIDYRQDDVSTALARLRERLSPSGDVTSAAAKERTIAVFGEPLTAEQVVKRICSEVETQGLAALLDYSAKLDRAELTGETLRVPAEELAAAHAEADDEFLKTIRSVRENLQIFQQAILHKNVRIETAEGGFLEQCYGPLKRIGVCVPGGAAAYPSTVLMTVVPAQVAGVEQIAVMAPPTEFGSYNIDILATCHELDITEVYRMGGAQGVAALAYGVDGLEKVDKIVGPGNLFVALAKRHVFGEVDIDSIAGPSEVLIIVDDTARADFVAADLIAQAEHSPGASVLVTWDSALADAVPEELTRQLATLERGDLARESLEAFGCLLLVESEAAAVAIANSLAPEHLQIIVKDPERLAQQIHSAGATFLGEYTPVATGDYVAGPSHVLPTGGTARFASGLSSNDFLRSSSLIHMSKSGLANVAGDLRRLANKEGLTAHRASVDIRLDS